MAFMICSYFTLVFFAVGASAQNEVPGLATPATDWVALVEIILWLVFVVVMAILFCQFCIAAMRIYTYKAMKYCSRRLFEPSIPPTPDSDGLAIELNNLPPLLSPSSTGDALDGPVSDSGSPTLLSSPPPPPLPGDVCRQ
ncbi:hypothetical protein ACN38_g12854 [Penicillium nordicum]|uniref:Uncharacterized protein n=1 Tax=Penicillium nordicum TaxID=229535 RepID=A0A0M9W9I6_9EURO|nr:hypothetical protein ACN38_g12854 [Penicillium nordicum]